MSRYADVIEKYVARGLGIGLKPITAERVTSLRKQFPDLPADYVDFLSEVGSGSVAGGGYSLFGGPISPEDVFDPETALRFQGILLIGTDSSEWTLGFEPTERELVEICCEDMNVVRLGMSFEAFIRTEIAQRLGP